MTYCPVTNVAPVLVIVWFPEVSTVKVPALLVSSNNLVFAIEVSGGVGTVIDAEAVL